MSGTTSPESPESSIQAWEAAYMRFETPAEERAKFRRRLRGLGVESWPRDLLVTELFCGRGNGLVAWAELGFTRLEGLDISRELLSRYEGPATIVEGDARSLPFADASRDVVAVQGGLHHLTLMESLEQTADEIRRVLKPGGRLLVVEPWLTPFLRAVHAACDVRPLRKLWGRLDALHTMIENERETYEDWLSRPDQILDVLRRIAEPEQLRIGRGKLMLVGRRRDC